MYWCCLIAHVEPNIQQRIRQLLNQNILYFPLYSEPLEVHILCLMSTFSLLCAQERAEHVDRITLASSPEDDDTTHSPQSPRLSTAQRSLTAQY